MMLKISKAQYNEDGTINCEWDHPVHGVIPFTANPNDVEEHGRAIYQWLLDGEYGPIAPHEPADNEDTE